MDAFEDSLPAIKFGGLNTFYLQKCKNEALNLNKGNYEGLIDLWAACGKYSTVENWSKEESSFHITVLEMAAAFFAVKTYAATLSEISIHLRVENTATLAWINRQNAPNETAHLLLKEFWKFCAEKQIWVHASYISSSRYKVADKESRKLRHNLEWSLKEKFFEKTVENFGPVTTDLFASRVNCEVNRYYSYSLEPESIWADAFSYRLKMTFPVNYLKYLIFLFPLVSFLQY